MKRYGQWSMFAGAVACCAAFAVAAAAQVLPRPDAVEQYENGRAAQNRGNTLFALTSFRRAVEISPEYTEACAALADAAKSAKRDKTSSGGRDAAAANDILWAMWSFYFTRAAGTPDKAVYQWALGQFDDSLTQEAAERYFRKAIALDPGFATAYQSLAATLEYRGDLAAAREYQQKAWELRPQDPEILAAYARSLGEADRTLRRKLIDQFLSRFPRHPEGAELLSRLAVQEENLAARIAILEQLKVLYPPNETENSEWYIRFLFDAYNRTDPLKALSLAEEMTSVMPAGNALQDWQGFAVYARSLMTARSLMDRDSYAEASRLLDDAELPYLVSPDPQTLLRAEALDKAGDANKAYRTLVTAMAAEPSDGLRPALMRWGAKLKKTPAQVEADVWDFRLKKKSAVKDFKLIGYRDTKVVRLSDFRGRVVLLNFWQPLNWTSRDELPYLQKMLDKYGPQGFSVINVNQSPAEDALAALLMSRYGFISLHVPDEEWVADNYYVTSVPYSILIDRQGRALFWPAFWGFDPQHTFELELQAMLAYAPKIKK